VTTSLINSIIAFFSLLKETIQLLQRSLIFVRELQTFEINELIEEINAGNLRYGDKVTITGIFSDLVPVARKLMIPIQDASVFLDSLPCRPFSINGYYCGSIQNFDSKFAADPKGFPIFYKDNTPRPIMDDFSGFTMEIKGTLASIPFAWKRLLDLERPFCINTESIELAGAEKATFGTILWALAKTKKTISKPSEGFILHSDYFWTWVSRIGTSNRYFFVNGGACKIRHGCVNEEFDTIHDFYGINLLDEEEYNAYRHFLEAQTRNWDVEAVFDMTMLSSERISWLKKRIGL